MFSWSNANKLLLSLLGILTIGFCARNNACRAAEQGPELIAKIIAGIEANHAALPNLRVQYTIDIEQEVPKHADKNQTVSHEIKRGDDTYRYTATVPSKMQISCDFVRRDDSYRADVKYAGFPGAEKNHESWMHSAGEWYRLTHDDLDEPLGWIGQSTDLGGSLPLDLLEFLAGEESTTITEILKTKKLDKAEIAKGVTGRPLAIVVVDYGGGYRPTFEFDPEKNFAPVAKYWTHKDGSVASYANVTLKTMKNGKAYYPERIDVASFKPGRGRLGELANADSSQTVTCTKIDAEAPVPMSDVKLIFPKGTHLDDHVAEKSYEVK